MLTQIGRESFPQFVDFLRYIRKDKYNSDFLDYDYLAHHMYMLDVTNFIVLIYHWDNGSDSLLNSDLRFHN